MLSISTPKRGTESAANYYLDDKLEYYLHGLDKEGQWHGKGASSLGFTGAVDRQTFMNVLAGFSPDGKTKLVQNAGDVDRQGYWDLTFNAPKSVSVLWAMAPEAVRKEIEQSHSQAVCETLAYFEETGGFSRRGKGGKKIDPATLAFATFVEGTSRAQDPHLHTHCVLVNVGVRPDGTTGTLMTEEVFRHKMAGGEFYQIRLAAKLHQRLGLNIELERVSFRIDGVPKEVCRFFSKRRQKIELVMESRNLHGAVAAKEITLETRSAKEEVPSAILFPRWQKEGRTLGWSSEQAMALLHSAQQRTKNPIPDRTDATGLPKAQSKIVPDEPTHSLVPEQPLINGLKKRTHAEQNQHNIKEASDRLFQEAIDRILDDHYAPPSSADSSQESTHTHSESQKESRDKDSKTNDPGQGPDPGEKKTENQRGKEKSKPKDAQHDSRHDSETDKKDKTDERKQSRINQEFVWVYLAMLDRMHPETQTRKRLERLAWWLGRHMGADEKTITEIFTWLVPGAEWSMFHVERPRLFPKSFIKRIYEIRLPKLGLGYPAHRWTKIRWKLNLFVAELRIQHRRLVPGAPRWSPLHGIEFPALRLVKKPADLSPKKPQSERNQERRQERDNKH